MRRKSMIISDCMIIGGALSIIEGVGTQHTGIRVIFIYRQYHEWFGSISQRIGYDILEESDIIDAAKELSGTYFANIQPNRAKKEINQLDDNSEKINNKRKKVAIKTIPGISNLFY
ncbi:hypothetical protein C2G38_2233323 [Gigaspora rosea]|uniref:Uncharacterized protein n=1 Tax=Gigaspora rosea TaxID=44941 RepID=A0A397TRE3_9GLOM|nr:hypothetical protein C2G38_2233323 [Gigaspora rosea]